MQFNNIKKQLLFLSLLIAVLSFSACRKGIQTIDKNAQEKTLAGNALALVAPGNIWYVSYLNGNDATASANDITKPFKTIQQAVYYSSPGDSIFLRGDAVHLLTQEVGINNVGTAAQHYKIQARGIGHYRWICNYHQYADTYFLYRPIYRPAKPGNTKSQYRCRHLYW
jgi:hypothetical protein